MLVPGLAAARRYVVLSGDVAKHFFITKLKKLGEIVNVALQEGGQLVLYHAHGGGQHISRVSVPVALHRQHRASPCLRGDAREGGAEAHVVPSALCPHVGDQMDFGVWGEVEEGRVRVHRGEGVAPQRVSGDHLHLARLVLLAEGECSLCGGRLQLANGEHPHPVRNVLVPEHAGVGVEGDSVDADAGHLAEDASPYGVDHGDWVVQVELEGHGLLRSGGVSPPGHFLTLVHFRSFSFTCGTPQAGRRGA